MTPPRWERVLEVNLTAPFLLARALGRGMVERGAGKVIFTASLLSFQGGILVPSYTAAKSGVAGLVKALANEWAPHGVNVNAIAPGYIATDNTEALRSDPDRSRAILERIPAGRWGVRRRPRRSDRVPRIRRRPTTSAGRSSPSMAAGSHVERQRRPRTPLRAGVIPVVVADEIACRPLGDALKRGGLPVAEVTFRTAAAVEALRLLAPDPDLLVGAGTDPAAGAGRPRTRRRRALRRDAGVQRARARPLPRARTAGDPGRRDRDRGDRGA